MKCKSTLIFLPESFCRLTMYKLTEISHQLPLHIHDIETIRSGNRQLIYIFEQQALGTNHQCGIIRYLKSSIRTRFLYVQRRTGSYDRTLFSTIRTPTIRTVKQQQPRLLCRRRKGTITTGSILFQPCLQVDTISMTGHFKSQFIIYRILLNGFHK